MSDVTAFVGILNVVANVFYIVTGVNAVRGVIQNRMRYKYRNSVKYALAADTIALGTTAVSQFDPILSSLYGQDMVDKAAHASTLFPNVFMGVYDQSPALALGAQALFFASGAWALRKSPNIVQGEVVRKELSSKSASVSTEVAAENRSMWNRVVAEGDSLVARWAELSTSAQNILKYPMLANPSEPAVAQVIMTVSTVRAERRETCPNPNVDPWETSYGKAVRDLREQLITVQNLAKDAVKNYSPEERKKLERARQLLNMVYDNTGATVHERANAYSQLTSLMEDLQITLSDDAAERFAIEVKDIRAIEAA